MFINQAKLGAQVALQDWSDTKSSVPPVHHKWVNFKNITLLIISSYEKSFLAIPENPTNHKQAPHMVQVDRPFPRLSL